MSTNNPLVEAVRKHAMKNYEASFGWSEVIECYEDEEILEVIEGAATPEEAIAKMAQIVEIRNERYREAVGPDVACGTCGAMFPENTVCPNERDHMQDIMQKLGVEG